MLGRSRSLRTGLRRPTALRFDSPLSSCGGGRNRLSPFGDGTYSGNIMQDGNVLRPQDYMLRDSGEVLHDCIVVTGAATVAPDWSAAGAAAFMCQNLVLDGATASLASSVNCKGLLGFIHDGCYLRGGAHLHMDKLGKAGMWGDLSPDMLLPESFARRIAKDKLKAYVIKGRGAEGGAAIWGNSVANSGLSAGKMQTGGGGTGYSYNAIAGRGGCGGPCCGGAGSGGANMANSADAGDFGGPGGPGAGSSNGAASGGSGDPVGSRSPTGGGNAYPGNGAGGGLVELFTSSVDIDLGCVISADGANGGGRNSGDLGTLPGGGAGGGCIVIVTRPGGYTNLGTVRAAGGQVTGGAGSVNVFELWG